MSVKLRKRKNGDGTTSLYLDIYHNGERKYEFLKHLKLIKASNPADRQQNKENMQLAEKITVKKAQELSANDYDMTSDIGKKTIVAEWMQTYVDRYKKKDKRNMQGALNRFIKFLEEEQLTGLTFGRLSDIIIGEFQDSLVQQCTGEGASSYFARFKKMVKQAYLQKLITSNPAAAVKTKQGKAKRKDTLSVAEIQLLASTNCESPQVKKAFLFSCLTGLRWIDVSNLKWSDVNYQSKFLVKRQNKTDHDVHINLNSAAISLIGKPAKPDEFVFSLPTANGANKTVKAWVKRAGIEKKVTWHNARHSFGTNLIYHGADVITASSLLGHSTLKHTQRYVKAANELKEKATDSLNIQL